MGTQDRSKGYDRSDASQSQSGGKSSKGSSSSGKSSSSGFSGSSSSKGGRVGGGSTSSSKGFSGSGDTGRFGGGTSGSTGKGFGGSTGSQYGGGSSSSKSGRVGSGSFSGGAGAGRGISQGGPSLGGKSTSTASAGAGAGRGVSPGGPSLGKSTPAASAGAGRGLSPGGPSLSTPSSPGYGWGNKGGRVGTGAYGGRTAGPGRGVSPGGPSIAGTTIGPGRGLSVGGQTVAEINARTSMPTAERFGYTGKGDRLSSIGPGRGLSAGGQTLAERSATVDRQIAGYTEYGQTRERQRVATADRLANERRADLAQLGRASNAYSDALAASDAESLKGSYRDAIAGRETEGIADPYAAKHADVKRKDGSITNAYGKYGVMEDNIGPWTKEVVGKAMTPAEFLANPAAQDAVFDAKFGEYVGKYGTFERASQAWYGGPGAVGKPERGPRPGNPGPTVGTYSSDAVGRQINAYDQRTEQARSQIAQTETGVTGAQPATRTAAGTDRFTSMPAGTTEPAYDPTVETRNRPDPSLEAAPAPTPAPRTDRVTTSAVPAELAIQQPTAAKPYQRSLTGHVVATGIDVLTGPLGALASLGTGLTLGTTVGGAVWDASHGKYGENQYEPGGPQSPGYGNRLGTSGSDSASARYTPPKETATGTTAEQVEEEVETATTPTTYAETFVAKYIDPPKEPPRAVIPDPTYDWVPKQHTLGPFSWEV